MMKLFLPIKCGVHQPRTGECVTYYVKIQYKNKIYDVSHRGYSSNPAPLLILNSHYVKAG